MRVGAAGRVAIWVGVYLEQQVVDDGRLVERAEEVEESGLFEREAEVHGSSFAEVEFELLHDDVACVVEVSEEQGRFGARLRVGELLEVSGVLLEVLVVCCGAGQQHAESQGVCGEAGHGSSGVVQLEGESQRSDWVSRGYRWWVFRSRSAGDSGLPARAASAAGGSPWSRASTCRRAGR